MPIEVKSRNVSSLKSLENFRDKFSKKTGERYIVSVNSLSYGDNLTYLPYYMLYAI